MANMHGPIEHLSPEELQTLVACAVNVADSDRISGFIVAAFIPCDNPACGDLHLTAVSSDRHTVCTLRMAHRIVDNLLTEDIRNPVDEDDEHA